MVIEALGNFMCDNSLMVRQTATIRNSTPRCSGRCLTHHPRRRSA
jgi:hypothetical protein